MDDASAIIEPDPDVVHLVRGRLDEHDHPDAGREVRCSASSAPQRIG
jgi:hypothetical protein